MTRSPAWPNGVCPRSWPSAIASVSSFVQPQDLGDGPGDLRHLQRVRQPRPIVIAGRREEHLRLVLEAAKRLAVDDAIAVALKRRPDVVFTLRPQASPRVGALGGLRRQQGPLASLRAVRGSSRYVCDRASVQSMISLRKLVPCASLGTSNACASVWPRSANVSPRAEIDRAHTPAAHKQRHVLARVIRARPSSDRCRDPR